jgi:hypothetical protein
MPGWAVGWKLAWAGVLPRSLFKFFPFSFSFLFCFLLIFGLKAFTKPLF